MKHVSRQAKTNVEKWFSVGSLNIQVLSRVQNSVNIFVIKKLQKQNRAKK